MPRQQRTPVSYSTESTLTLSSLHIRIEGLEEEHQWFLKQIRRKRTELNNFVEQMRFLATEIFKQGTPIFKQLGELDREIHSLFTEILTQRKFGKQTRKDILGIYENLQMMGIISPKSVEDDEEAELDEIDELFEADEENQSAHYQFNNSDRDRQPDEPLQPEATRSETTKKIRQTFLRLAEIFHPDKVRDDETQMRHTEIMKEINKAYQEGDMAKLLEIEQQHQAGEVIDTDSESDLQRRCRILEQQNKLLKTQYENLKRELRLVKKTPEGLMVSDYRKAKRQGIDAIAEMLAEVEAEMKTIASIRNFVRDFRDRKLTIKDFLKGPIELRDTSQELIEDLFEEMFGVPITVITR